MQKENLNLNRMIHAQNEAIESARTEIDNWREQYLKEKRSGIEQQEQHNLAVESHELAIRKLKEQHTKQIQDIQENELKPLQAKLSELT